MRRECFVGRHAVSVDLNDLNGAPGPYTMSFGFELGPLRESIEEIGLVHPPCVVREGEGRIEIVSGYRRILALKQLGWPKVVCEDVSSLLESPLERLLFAFHENRVSRPFNSVEKAMVLSRLEPLLDKETILKRFMPLLSLPSHEDTLRFYVELAGMKQEVRDALAAGLISLNTTKSLLALTHESAECSFQCIRNLILNFNQQLQFIDIMTDISYIEGRGFFQILDSESIRSVLENRQLNKPQKARRLLEELRSRRFPRLMEAEKRFQESLNRLSLPEGTRISHPAFFEAPGYRLEVDFREGEDLMDRLRRLSLLPGMKEFRDLTDEDD
jgi:ParB-like nuclease domain